MGKIGVLDALSALARAIPITQLTQCQAPEDGRDRKQALQQPQSLMQEHGRRGEEAEHAAQQEEQTPESGIVEDTPTEEVEVVEAELRRHDGVEDSKSESEGPACLASAKPHALASCPPADAPDNHLNIVILHPHTRLQNSQNKTYTDKMPFGLKKSSKEGDSLDAQKSSLFGRSKSSKSPAPQAANPYATPPPANDPYAQRPANPYANNAAQSDPYAPRSQSNLSQPPVSSMSSLSLGSQASAPPSYSSQANLQPSPNRQQNYTTSAQKYSGGGSYGQTGGYGSDPYGGSAGQSRYGAGGYGGLGRRPSTDTMTTDAGRNALFGDAPARVAAQQQQQPQDNSYSNAGGYGQSDMPGGYGAERELTAEEEEEQSVQATKDQIRMVKGDTLSSIKRSLAAIDNMDQVGSTTLGNLHRQGEMLNNTERNLDHAAVQASRSKDKAGTLKRLNDRPFFIPENPTNPFASKEKRYNRQLEESSARHLAEKREREKTAAEAYQSKARAEQYQKDMRNANQQPIQKKTLADRARFQFEADDEDDAVEDGIEEGVGMLGHGVHRVHLMAQAMSKELDRQLDVGTRLIEKTDNVEGQIHTNTTKLEMISNK